MITEAERQALENCRTGPAGVDRAAIAILLDHDAEAARAELVAEEAALRRHFKETLPPQIKRFGFSPCGMAALAACDVLVHSPANQKLRELAIAFDPAVKNVAWNGCKPGAIDLALALIAWLSADDALCTRHLVRCRPESITDRLLAEVISLLVRDRGHEVGAVLARLAGEYVAAMAQGLWRIDPDAFLHVRLLAALCVGAERGCLELAALPDVIPYVPIWFINLSHV